ncbi:hypothetical protein EDD17DRAFT_176749 [Pisolithus thermaeus]|nr:hypothetical protein EV401DRAFT_103166 [Pisolithus croceorrhizus]KAI6165657.1 hypothetical protein EDD17DRAFT_176749 [Pisolithus thermaeus]
MLYVCSHEHRKRATKSGSTCPFFSFAQPTAPAKLTRSESIKAGKKSTTTLQKHSRTHSRTRSRKEDKAMKVDMEDRETQKETETEAAPEADSRVDEEPRQSPSVPPDLPIEMENDDPEPPLPAPEPEPEPEPEPARISTPDVVLPALPAPTPPVPDAKVQVPMIVEDSVFYTAPTPILPPSEVLTEEEREMSVEQWIRREISLSYDKLMADGQRQILLFKEKAADVRRRIDAL